MRAFVERREFDQHPRTIRTGLPAIPFCASMVGLVVRGKRTPGDEPDVMDQHADCILPDGAPIGFYGDGSPRNRTFRSSTRVGMNMRGVVYDYQALRAARPWYVNARDAISSGVTSTVLTIDVGTGLAARFAAYWAKLAAMPGGFDFVGNNCSTHASNAFVVSGILTGGIPGLDTPNNLYRQLVATMRARTVTYCGYVGFVPRPRGGFDVTVE